MKLTMTLLCLVAALCMGGCVETLAKLKDGSTWLLHSAGSPWASAGLAEHVSAPDEDGIRTTLATSKPQFGSGYINALLNVAGKTAQGAIRGALERPDRTTVTGTGNAKADADAKSKSDADARAKAEADARANARAEAEASATQRQEQEQGQEQEQEQTNSPDDDSSGDY